MATERVNISMSPYAFEKIMHLKPVGYGVSAWMEELMLRQVDLMEKQKTIKEATEERIRKASEEENPLSATWTSNQGSESLYSLRNRFNEVPLNSRVIQPEEVLYLRRVREQSLLPRENGGITLKE